MSQKFTKEFKIFIILAIICIFFINTVSYAADTKEITVKYLDSNGNPIKQEETTEIETGSENVTKYSSSYKTIENGTNLFPASISGAEIESANVKVYYDGDTSGNPDESAVLMLDNGNDRIAITSPNADYTYIVEFIYTYNGPTANIVGNWVSNTTVASSESEFPNTGSESSFPFYIIPMFFALIAFIGYIKYNY